MDELEVLVARDDGASLPGYATTSSSGLDLRAHLSAPVALPPMGRALIPTGIRVSVPDGFEAQVRPRSGLAIEHGVTVLNTPGLIILGSARMFGVLPGHQEPSLGEWIWLASILSASFWGLVVYLVIGLVDRRANRAGKSPAI